MSDDIERLRAEVDRLRKLESVVVRVLSQKGDDHCWRDIYTEMAGLVGVEFAPEVLDKTTMLRNCEHFVDCLLKGEHYIAPSVAETDRLRAERESFRRLYGELQEEQQRERGGDV